MKTSVKFGAAMLALAMTLLAGLGGTALLLQGGHHPNLRIEWYEDLFQDIKRRYPIHLHALSPSGLPALAAEPAAAGAGVGSEIWTWGLAAAAASTALAALGAGFAVAKVGTAAIGALAEKPELFGRLLIFVGLAEGIAIYGLIVSILILNRLA